MGASAVTQNSLNPYLRTGVLPMEGRPIAVDTQEENWLQHQRKAKDRASTTYIDIDAEAVAVTQTPFSTSSLPAEISLAGQRYSRFDSLVQEDFAASKTLNYTPSKKKDGGIEFHYDNQPLGRTVNLIA